MEDKNYTAYHVHSDLSLLDSCTKYQDYIDKAVELGQKAICFTEHGNIYNWVRKKYACDKAGIKYLHGCEVYLTEQLEPKVRDNYHTILIAKNMNGLREINSLISLSNTADHFYFKPRITFEEFLNISNDVIKISACLASPLNKLDTLSTSYEKLLKKYDYYEIQPHINSEEQKKYNKKLFEYSKKYNKPLIAGTDTHSIDKYKAECRSILQLAKGIEFTNEDEFDLTYKSYDELVNMFKEQASLPRNVYLEAIENTNYMADSTDEIVLDESFKYPKVYDDDIAEIKNRLNKMLQQKINDGVIPKEQRSEFIRQIREEVEVFEKINMCGFMLFMSDLIQWCHENNIPTGPARGSCGGSCVAYVLDIIDLNPIQWKTVFSRFANENRKEIGDIDIDFAPNDREAVYNHMIEKFGSEYTDYILAIGTVSDKGTIDEIGRALSRKFPGDKRFSLDTIKKIKKEYDKNPERAKTDYPDIFYYFDGILNTSISQSMHPCGMVVSPITLADNYGEFYRDGKKIIQIDMDAIHDVSLVKYDVLGLKNIGIIKDACKNANVSYPKTYGVDWNDQKVWGDMLRTPIGIFQFEGAYAFQMLCKFKPKNIFDMSLVTAALRPSGASYRDGLMAKKMHKNPSELIDNMLKDNYGYLVYQEDIIKFLQEICGLSGSEADNVRRGIARKKPEILEKAMPAIMEGYCGKSEHPREQAEVEAKEFLQIIEDASSYMFGYNHSVAYCLVGYLCAYLRYYYPAEFITSYLNNSDNEDDIVSGYELAKIYHVDIHPPRFRHSIDKYILDKNTNSIYKGVSSIKYLNSGAPSFLYSLKDNNYNTFVELLVDIAKSNEINTRQMEILIKLQFFQEFGNNKKLLKIYELFNKVYGKKQISKNKLLEYELDENLVRKYATKESDTNYYMEGSKKDIIYLVEKPARFKTGEKAVWMKENAKEVQFYGLLPNKPVLSRLAPITRCYNAKTSRMIEMLKEIEQNMPNETFSIRQQIEYEKEYAGYISMTYNVDKSYCYVLDVDFKYSPKIKLYSLGSGKETWCKVNKNTFAKSPFGIGTVLSCIKFEKRPRYMKTENGFEKTEEKEWWLNVYEPLEDDEINKILEGGK